MRKCSRGGKKKKALDQFQRRRKDGESLRIFYETKYNEFIVITEGCGFESQNCQKAEHHGSAAGPRNICEAFEEPLIGE